MGKTRAGWWDEHDRIARLTQMWLEGFSGSEIKRDMGATSRSAVIGKVHRLKLERPRSSKQSEQAIRRPAKPVADIPDFLGEQRRERARATALANIAARQAADEATKSGGVGLELRPQHRAQKPPQPNRRAKFRRPAKPVADIPDFLGEQRRERARATALANIAARQAADEATKSGGVGFFDHKEGQCRWPLTEARPISEFRFCGAKAADGTYCIEHARRSIKRYFVAEAPE